MSETSVRKCVRCGEPMANETLEWKCPKCGYIECIEPEYCPPKTRAHEVLSGENGALSF